MLSLTCLRSLPLAVYPETLQLQNYLLQIKKKKEKKKECTELYLFPSSDFMIKQIPRRQMQYDNKYNRLEYLIAV